MLRNAGMLPGSGNATGGEEDGSKLACRTLVQRQVAKQVAAEPPTLQAEDLRERRPRFRDLWLS